MSQFLQLTKTGLYIALNITSGVGIIFANKAVFSLFQFHFIYALTFTHAVATAVGMFLFCRFGLFEHKKLPVLQVLPLAVAFVGYIVGWNLCLQMNPVGFYQLSKIMITPAVVVIEIFVSSKYPSQGEQWAIGLLCTGVALATVTDPSVSTGFVGLVIGAMAVGFTAIYQVRAASQPYPYISHPAKCTSVSATCAAHQCCNVHCMPGGQTAWLCLCRCEARQSYAGVGGKQAGRAPGGQHAAHAPIRPPSSHSTGPSRPHF